MPAPVEPPGKPFPSPEPNGLASMLPNDGGPEPEVDALAGAPKVPVPGAAFEVEIARLDVPVEGAAAGGAAGAETTAAGADAFAGSADAAATGAAGAGIATTAAGATGAGTGVGAGVGAGGNSTTASATTGLGASLGIS